MVREFFGTTPSDILFRTASEALLRPSREERGIIPDSLRKPGDIFLPDWSLGRDTALDVSVTSPIQASLVERAAEVTGYAADARFKTKIASNYSACNQQGVEFIPLIVETHGGWDPRSLKVIKKIAGQLSSHTGKDQAEATNHLLQKLAISLVKSNTGLILSRKPKYSHQSLDGIPE